MKFKKKFAALVVIPMLALTACGVSAQETVTKVQVGAGPIEAPKFKGCIKPGEKRNTPTNDDYFAYPTSERDYDATGQDGADSAAITVVSKDNAEMAIPLTIRFSMVTDCDTLKEFHKSYGARYGAYLNDDGTSSDGWNKMLRKLMRDPVDSTLDEIAKKYTWRQMYNDAAAQNEIQTTLKTEIGKIVEEQAKGNYFEDYVVLVKKPEPTNEELKSAIAKEQSAVATAQSAEAEAKAKEATARAETATAKANAAKQKAEIEGFGGFENFAKYKAVEGGLNPWQPTYKVSDTK